jgi:putative tryptophan/tyrosine transport system substrate-binding protein
MVIGIGRRNFITGLGAATAWPLAAHAQLQPKMLRVGMVWIGPRTLPYWVAFDQRMHELGYVEGENLTVEFLDLNGHIEGFDEGMKELVRRKVDIIIALGAEAPLKAAMTATQTTPIVVAAIDYDPLALGYVSGLARPAGNVTGVVFQQIELTMKRLEPAA